MSDVALLTRSIAAMNAPAKAAAVSRLAEKVANIVLVPFFFGPPMGHATLNAGTVPNWICLMKSVVVKFGLGRFAGLRAANW